MNSFYMQPPQERMLIYLICKFSQILCSFFSNRMFVYSPFCSVYFNVTFDSKKISKLSCWTCFSILQVWRIYYIPVRPWNKFRVTLCLEISWLKLLQQWLAWLSALNVPTCFATQKHFALCRQSAFLALIYSSFALSLHQIALISYCWVEWSAPTIIIFVGHIPFCPTLQASGRIVKMFIWLIDLVVG